MIMEAVQESDGQGSLPRAHRRFVSPAIEEYEMLRAFLIAFAFAASPSALAAGGDAAALDVSASFAEQHERIRAEMADGKTYSEISAQGRKDVRVALERMDAALGGQKTLEDLTEQERVDVFNDQELVNTILTQAREDSRLLCQREKTVGSHRATTHCQTVAERRRMREQSQSDLLRSRRAMHIPSN